jgi:hypothetical protein
VAGGANPTSVVVPPMAPGVPIPTLSTVGLLLLMLSLMGLGLAMLKRRRQV